MVASERLLEVALNECEYGRLRTYYLKHLNEERHHAEWLAEDLKKMGVTPEYDYRAATIAGSQYYHIFHDHPALLLGYMFVLEAWPKPLDVIEQIEQKYGPLRTLRYHAEHDPDHVKDLEAEINALPDELSEKVYTNIHWVNNTLLDVFANMESE